MSAITKDGTVGRERMLGSVVLPSGGADGWSVALFVVATLFGLVFFSHQVDAFFGAWLGGYAFDMTGSYTGVWIIAPLLAALAGLRHLPVAERSLRPSSA